MRSSIIKQALSSCPQQKFPQVNLKIPDKETLLKMFVAKNSKEHEEKDAAIKSLQRKNEEMAIVLEELKREKDKVIEDKHKTEDTVREMDVKLKEIAREKEAAEKVLEERVKKLEKAKDAVEKVLEERVKKLEEEKDAVEKVFEERVKKLEEAKGALEKALQEEMADNRNLLEERTQAQIENRAKSEKLDKLTRFKEQMSSTLKMVILINQYIAMYCHENFK